MTNCISSARHSLRSSTFFSSTLLRPPGSTLFPYTTLFRSGAHYVASWGGSPGGGEEEDRRCQHHAREHGADTRSEEHTSELQSRGHLVCRLLLEKKKKKKYHCVIHNRKSTYNSICSHLVSL